MIGRPGENPRQGFTLLELVTVLAIIGIISAFAVPGFFRWLNNYRLKSAISDLYVNLHLARMRALKMGSFCTVEFNDDGYRIFEDRNNDMSFQDGERIVAKVGWAKYATVSLAKNTFVNQRMAFTRGGLTRGGGGGFGAGTLRLRGSTGRELAIVVSSLGRIRVE